MIWFLRWQFIDGVISICLTNTWSLISWHGSIWQRRSRLFIMNIMIAFIRLLLNLGWRSRLSTCKLCDLYLRTLLYREWIFVFASVLLFKIKTCIKDIILRTWTHALNVILNYLNWYIIIYFISLIILFLIPIHTRLLAVLSIWLQISDMSLWDFWCLGYLEVLLFGKHLHFRVSLYPIIRALLIHWRDRIQLLIIIRLHLDAAGDYVEHNFVVLFIDLFWAYPPPHRFLRYLININFHFFFFWVFFV